MVNFSESDFLQKTNFKKYLDKLGKKLKGKPIIVYGAGALFQVMYDNYDLSVLNIIGIADKKYEESRYEDELPEYQHLKPSEITSHKPYAILLSTLRPTKVLQYLYNDILINDKSIKVDFLFKKSTMELILEIWQTL